MFLVPEFCIILLIQFCLAFSFTNITTFYFPSFTWNSQDIIYSGNARASSEGVIDLTTNPIYGEDATNVGRAVYAKPIRLYDKNTSSVADIVTHFTFLINSSLNGTFRGGDGLTFFLSRLDWTLPANSSGTYLGLLDKTRNGLATNKLVAVEIDTYDSDSSEPNGNHMGIDVNSLLSSVTSDWQWDTNRILNGEAWILYNSTTRVLSARMTNKNLQPYTEWNISYPIDLTEFLPDLVVVGFSASSLASLESHRILSWNFSSYLTTPNPTATKHFKSKFVIILVPLLFLGGFSIVVMILIRGRNRMNYHKRKEMNGAEWKEKEQEASETYNVDMLANFHSGPRRFSYVELGEATKFFSEEERLGKGGFGGVYKGVLKDTNEVVAVKRLSKDSSQGIKEYISEVTVISRLRHRNLVPLIGWCHEGCERLLVYEYMEGGCLDCHLFSPNTEQVLSWERRMRIALDIANALLYLHEEWEQCVIHRDVKTSNVMMDSAFNGCLGDFGLARLVNHGFSPETTMMAGTIGYIAPECLFTGKVSKESDVYSYGVVLLEIACGRRALRSVGEKGTRLVEWVWGLYGSDSLLEAIDERLGSEFNKEEAECMMMVGLWCALPDMESRPTIREAIQTLRFQAKLPKLPPKMPTLVFYVPPTSQHRGDFNVPLSTSTGATTTSVTTAVSSTKEWSMLHSYNEEIGSR